MIVRPFERGASCFGAHWLSVVGVHAAFPWQLESYSLLQHTDPPSSFIGCLVRVNWELRTHCHRGTPALLESPPHAGGMSLTLAVRRDNADEVRTFPASCPLPHRLPLPTATLCRRRHRVLRGSPMHSTRQRPRCFFQDCFVVRELDDLYDRGVYRRRHPAKVERLGVEVHRIPFGGRHGRVVAGFLPQRLEQPNQDACMLEQRVARRQVTDGSVAQVFDR